MIALQREDPLVLRLLLMLAICLPVSIRAGPIADAVKQMNLQELQETFDTSKVARSLGGYGDNLQDGERQAAAVLITMGILELEDLRNRNQVQAKLTDYRDIYATRHFALLGRTGDATLPMKIDGGWAFSHEELFDELFIETLAERLADGVITGYDIRLDGVYENFPPGRTLIYSQSSIVHLQQLVTLMASEGLSAWVYMTPKISAFLYRDDWGPTSGRVRTLDSGIRVVEGEEFAVMFRFDTENDRYRFHDLVLEYAKKDEEDETGLIANAWWQPFYYSDRPMEGFEPISLVILDWGHLEATLTVPERKSAAVVDAFRGSDADTRVDRVWVNPAFYRFLHGGYK